MNVKILIVEDDPDWQNELQKMLSSTGYKSKISSNYGEAVDALDKERPSILMLDLKLKEGESDEDLQGWKIAEIALEKDVPIIVVTGHPSVSRARRAFREYKVVDFLDKERLTKTELVIRVLEGIKASQQRQLSDPEKQKAIEKIKKIFYQGQRIKPRRHKG